MIDNLKYTEILQLNKALEGKIEGKEYTIKILSNVTVNNFAEIFQYYLRLHNIPSAIEVGNYDNIVQDSAEAGKEDLFLVMYELLNIIDSNNGYFEDQEEDFFQTVLNKLKMEIDMIFRNLSQVPLVVFNKFSTAYLVPSYGVKTNASRLAADLNTYVERNLPANVFLLTIDEVFMQCGVQQAFDKRFYQSSKAPYSIAFFKEYCKAIIHPILKNTGKLKKAIIFDCDNTLWKGVLGEDGKDGIKMSAADKEGYPYRMIQQMAVFLSKRGVIVGICSKNNPEDVDAVLAEHNDIVLKSDYIVIKKVNWEDKASNLRNIATELNIGLNSLVFVDDSDFEITFIKEQLPEVLAIQVPKTGYIDLLQVNIFKYFNLSPTADDAKKTEMYKQQFLRDDAKKSAGSIEDYLSSLEMEITIKEDDQDQVARIAQLTQKTNQFNLTTRRKSESEIKQLIIAENDAVFSLSVKDKFGDNGLTGVCVVMQNTQSNKIANIDMLLMSCRVIGRKIEVVFVSKILSLLKQKGYQTVYASFLKSPKNAQVKDFYEKIGFSILKEDQEIKFYELDLVTFEPSTINYIRVNN